ncbi:MAG: tetratricopeptide repeat protein [Bacteroidetes bacterium]|nr:tetratricopeptide repeat protein [Bacteroidota bacterium]
MAKPKQKVLPSQNLYSNNFLSGYEKYFLPIVIAITFICFFPSLQDKFTNLDDTNYIIDNPVVKNINAENIKAIFSKQFVGNYQPLTMLSYMVDYKFFGLNPFGWHLINLIFYLLCVALVFLIAEKFSAHKPIAFITSLLFGIHTLHVESVTWISERKDVLYGFLFLWSLYLYILHAKQDKRFSKYFFFSLFLFVLSILSKAQAVVLPVLFFAVDFLMNRRFDKKLFIEKIPFFALAFIFGFIAIKVQGKAGAMQTFQYFPFYERILFSCYALMTYLHKMILPVNLSCFYPYPETNDKINTVWVYLSPVVLLAIAFLIWKFFRREKIVLFGFAFFLITIILVLQLLPIGDALYADRYTFIPSIGIFFIASNYLVPHLKNRIVLTIASGYLLFFSYLTFRRTKIWHDSITLYADAINHGYKAAIIYNNRGAVLSDSSRNEEALKDFTSLVELKPRYPNGWRNKGLVEERLKNFDEAIKSYTEEIKYYPDDTKNYLSRGTIYVNRNDFENAIKDFSKMIGLNPNSGEGYYARSEALGKSGKLNEALADINKAIEFSPDNGQAYNNRGIIFSMSGRYQEAVNDFTKSLQLKPGNTGAYTNRALAYKGMKKYSEALQDMMTAKEKGIAVDENSISELKNLAAKNQ